MSSQQQNQPINLTKLADTRNLSDVSEVEMVGGVGGPRAGVLLSGGSVLSARSQQCQLGPPASSLVHQPAAATIVSVGTSRPAAVRLAAVSLSLAAANSQSHHGLSYQMAPNALAARMLVPVSVTSSVNASPAVSHSTLVRPAVPQSGAVVKAITRCGRLASVTVAPSAGSSRPLLTASRTPLSHMGVVRTGTPHARLCSVASPSAAAPPVAPSAHAPVPAPLATGVARPGLHVTGLLAAPPPMTPVGIRSYRSLVSMTTPTATTIITQTAATTPAAAGAGGAVLQSRATITAVTAAAVVHHNNNNNSNSSSSNSYQQQQQHQPHMTVVADKPMLSMTSAHVGGQAVGGGGGGGRHWGATTGPGLTAIPSSVTVLPIAKVLPQPPTHAAAATGTASAAAAAAAAHDIASLRETALPSCRPGHVSNHVTSSAVLLTRPPLAFSSAFAATAATAAAAGVGAAAAGVGAAAAGVAGVGAILGQCGESVIAPVTSHNTDVAATAGGGGGGGGGRVLLDNRLLTATVQSPHAARVNTSPRPSILRKRDSEIVGGRASRDLTRQLADMASAPVSCSPPPPSLSLSLVSQCAQQQQQQQLGVTGNCAPLAALARERRLSSSGHSSSTVSASSSPGEAQPPDDIVPLAPSTPTASEEAPPSAAVTPSPRRKPRKQNFGATSAAAMVLTFPNSSTLMEPQLAPGACCTGPATSTNQSQSAPAVTVPGAAGSELSQNGPGSGGAAPKTVFRRPVMSLLQSAGLNDGSASAWRANSSHFDRYQDVRAKDDRRPTVVDLANGRRVGQHVNGWKIHQLTAQTEQLLELERSVHGQLSQLLGSCEQLQLSRREQKELAKLVELIRSNLQRSKITSDQLSEAGVQLSGVFQHKATILSVLDKYARKRPSRKRERH